MVITLLSIIKFYKLGNLLRFLLSMQEQALPEVTRLLIMLVTCNKYTLFLKETCTCMFVLPSQFALSKMLFNIICGICIYHFQNTLSFLERFQKTWLQGLQGEGVTINSKSPITQLNAFLSDSECITQLNAFLSHSEYQICINFRYFLGKLLL